MKADAVRLESEITGPPGEIQILPYGYSETGMGAFLLDEEGMEEVVREFASRSNDMVIDYEHQSLSGGEAPAAGWIRRLLNRGAAGLWAVVEWTGRARQYLENREYRYLSPVFLKRRSDGRVVRLVNAALTNQPAIDGMAPVVNKTSHPEFISGSREMLKQVQHDKGKEEKSMKRLLELLGLEADATGEQAEEALASMKDEADALRAQGKEVRDLLGLGADADPAEVTGTIMAIRAAHEQAGDLGRRVHDLEGRLRRKEAEELVASAMKEGKVTPAQRDWALEYAGRDPEGFAVFSAKAAVVVHTEEIAPSFAPAAARDGLGEVQAQVNKALGISEGSFRKYSGKR